MKFSVDISTVVLIIHLLKCFIFHKTFKHRFNFIRILNSIDLLSSGENLSGKHFYKTNFSFKIRQSLITVAIILN